IALPAAGLAGTAATANPVRLTAAAEGRVIDAPGTDARAEVVTFGEPLAPGERADVRLTRFEVYAPGARIWKVEGARQNEVPRSRMAFFRGMAEDDPDIRVFVAVDPDTLR